MNLNQVTLPALNVAESVAFYKRMGFEIIVDTSHYARFKCPAGSASFSVEHSDSIPRSGTVIYFETEGLDDRVKQLQALGFVFSQGPRDERWLWREARLSDPSGNILCLYWAGVNRLDPPWRVRA
jgi:catechol 2,3-dioxygenase-like lactoylglutathione lyase family enzyme